MNLMEKIDKIKELRNCNAIKAILMCIVVLYHSMAVYMGNWGPYEPAKNSTFLMYIAKWFNTFHIYGFTLISGYIFYYIKYEGGGYKKYFPFIGKKAKRLIVPYIFIAAVWVIPVYAYFYGIEDIVNKFVLGTSPNQLWFLLMLFWVFAIFWLISDLTDRKPILGGIIVCGLYCLGVVAPSFYCLNSGLQYILFFYIGFMIRKLDLGNKILYKIPSLVYLLIDILLFIGIELIGSHEELIIKIVVLGLSVVLHIIGAVGAFVLLQRFVNRFLQENKVVGFFSKHSMVIYLVHQQLIYFSIGWFNGVVPPVVLVLINFIFSLTVSTIFSILMSKTKVTRFLVGSK